MTDRETAPREEYRRREAGHRERAANAGLREENISRARLGVALAAALIAWLAFGRAGCRRGGSWRRRRRSWSLLAVHRRIRRHRLRAERGAAYYRRGLARLDGQWAGTGRTRSALPRSPPSVCRRPRPLRRGLAVRAALRGPDEHGRGDARRLAAGAVGSGGGARAAGRRAGADAASRPPRGPGRPRRGGGGDGPSRRPHHPGDGERAPAVTRGFAWARRPCPR